MKKLLISSLLLCSVAMPFTYADEASHKAAASELLEVTNTKKMLEQMMGSMAGMIDQTFAASGIQVTDANKGKIEAVKKELTDWLNEVMNWQDMEKMYADIYIEVFTEDELKELIEFYKTPLGQKMLNKMPELMQKSMQKSQTLLQAKMPEFQQRLQKAVQEFK